MTVVAALPRAESMWQETLGWQPTEFQQQQFQRVYERVMEGNQQLNLTRITAPEEFWEKHLWDSLRGIHRLLKDAEGAIAEDLSSQAAASSSTEANPSAMRIIDIGTGAGFPGIPVAIALSQANLTLLDSTRKKLTFLDTLIADLALTNARTWVGRVEELGQQRRHRGHYNGALIRAVAPAPVCAEYALPLLKLGGTAVLYRGQWTEEEAIALQSALDQLGGTVESVEAFTTPLSHSVRHCLYLKKTASTPPEFPRAVGVPSHKPLA